jgi:hypothetical protein
MRNALFETAYPIARFSRRSIMTSSAADLAGESTVRAGAHATMLHALLWVQAVYYLATGIWPLVSIETFIAVTGPKTDHLITGRMADHWLVMTVGVLVTAIGLCLLSAAWRRSATREVVVIAVAAALGLTAIDVIYVARGVIPPIYLADAVLEVLILLCWGWCGYHHFNQR